MSRKCTLSKKKGRSANNVSHSKRRTKRRQEANLQWKRFKDPVTGKTVRVKVSTSILRTIIKNGLKAVLKKSNVTL